MEQKVDHFWGSILISLHIPLRKLLFGNTVMKLLALEDVETFKQITSSKLFDNVSLI